MRSPLDAALRQIGFSTHRIYALPVLVLMPFKGCNCRCSMCDIWKSNDEKEQLWRWEVAGWVEEFKHLRVHQVVLSGGEPLLHPDLWGICELLRSLPARVTLLTNGLLLEQHAAAAVRWCDEVIVSLDGPQTVHDEIRGIPGAFQRLAAGVEAIRKVAPKQRVTARCTVQRRNFRLIGEAVEAAWEMGLDRISFLAADVSTQAFNRPEPAERMSSIALDIKEAHEFEILLEDFIASREVEYAAGFIAESPQKIRRLPRYFAALNGDGRFPPVSCNAPWVSAVVEADGTVRPCFFRPPLGNLRKQPLEAILNSHQAVASRQDLEVSRDAICRKCVCTLRIS